ncbi:MAG: ComEC/Rec2 family competence protein [Ruminococcus sp.]|nr:ComEC/Rec2 family competence protein [Ruminococcus sp.]
MKRKLAYVGFAFFGGLFMSTIGWGKLNLIILAVSEIIMLALFFLLSKYRIYVTAIAVSFFVGVAYQSAYTHFVYDRIISYDNKDITFVGLVKDYTYLGSDNARMTVEGTIDNKVKTQITFFVDNDNYGYYDKVLIKSKVAKINDNLKFMAENYNRPKGEYLKGKGNNEVKILEHNTKPLLNGIKRYRDYLFNKINYYVQGDEGGFLGAMLCGDKSELSSITKTQIYRSGLGHILAVSGTHLAIVTMCFGFLFYAFIKNRKIRFILLEIIVWGFALFAGFSPSITRTAIMMTVVLLGDLIVMHADAMNTLGWCVLIMPLHNPYIVRDPSFLLSVTGAMAMGVIAPYVIKRVKYQGLAGVIIKSCVVLLAPVFTSIPVALLFFDEVSLATPFSNLILVPVCTFALGLTVVVAVTGGVAFIAAPILKVAGWLIHIVISIAGKISTFPYSYIDITNAKMRLLIALICIATVIAILLAKKVRFIVAYSVMAYCVILAVSNLSLLSDAGVTHFVFIPDKKNCQVVVYQNSKCVIADIGAAGSNSKTVWNVMTKRGVRSAESVLINTNCYYTAQKYMNVLYPQPSTFYGNFDSDDNMYKTDTYTRFDDIAFCKTADGYEARVDDTVVDMHGSEFCFDGRKFDLKSEEYPIEMIIDNKDIEVWRLDYGFDKQYRLG